jgi:hypothetical protein
MSRESFFDFVPVVISTLASVISPPPEGNVVDLNEDWYEIN